MTNRALSAAELLSARGIECAVLHVHTVKPLDESIAGQIKKARMAIIIEEHTLVGGLGSACMELLTDKFALVNIPPVYRMGLPDAFVHEYGDQDSLLEKYGLQPHQLAEKIFSLVSKGKSLETVLEAN